MSKPQFKKRTHRAKERLHAASPGFKWAFDACEKARLAGVDWPAHVFCATDAAEPLVAKELEKGGVLNQFLRLSVNEQMTMFAAGMMWASWRMTKGIYRFDDDIYQALIDTDKTGAIPTKILRQLPEWCVYIETPRLTCNFGTGQTQLFGVWASFALNANRELLMIYCDVDGSEFDELLPPCVHIDTSAETLAEGIKVVMAETQQANDSLAKQLENWLTPVINLLLYLCADREITLNNNVIEPENPQPKNTKKGWRLFAKQKTSFYDVGVRIGAALRKARTQHSTSADTGNKKQAHVRRAHWHTIVSGKRKNDDGSLIDASDRKRELRWLPPMPINVENIDNMPATIKPIKGKK